MYSTILPALGPQDLGTNTIRDFRFRHRILSNYYPKGVAYNNIMYPTVENAYQAAKVADPGLRATFNFPILSPSAARRLGQTVPLRQGWDLYRYDIMLKLVRSKFRDGYEREFLLATGHINLEEGNWWCDSFFGRCYGESFKTAYPAAGTQGCYATPPVLTPCPKCAEKIPSGGLNKLGEILMLVRDELIAGVS
jgi:predicted NAD-dependent protein-ADP-ribosyltransferase YbiA (DUF1768 family)